MTDADAQLLYGGTPQGVDDRGNAELHAKSLKGGKTMAMRPVEVVAIPAGIPHQLVLGAWTKMFRYLAFKMRV